MNLLLAGRVYRNKAGTHYLMLEPYCAGRAVAGRPESICVIRHLGSGKAYAERWAVMTDERRWTLLDEDEVPDLNEQARKR